MQSVLSSFVSGISEIACMLYILVNHIKREGKDLLKVAMNKIIFAEICIREYE